MEMSACTTATAAQVAQICTMILAECFAHRKLHKLLAYIPIFLFYFSEGKLDEVYNALVNAHPHMKVYKKEEIPNRLHYKHSRKIQPILAVADEGWEILQNKSDGFVCKYLFHSVWAYFMALFKIALNMQ